MVAIFLPSADPGGFIRGIPYLGSTTSPKRRMVHDNTAGAFFFLELRPGGGKGFSGR
jgi:hypothetical protein